jgi:hypothetical protein
MVFSVYYQIYLSFFAFIGGHPCAAFGWYAVYAQCFFYGRQVPQAYLLVRITTLAPYLRTINAIEPEIFIDGAAIFYKA